MFSHSYCILISSIIFAFHSSDLKVTIHAISIHFKTQTFNHPKCHKDPLLSSHKHHSQNTKSYSHTATTFSNHKVPLSHSHHFLTSQSPTLTQPASVLFTSQMSNLNVSSSSHVHSNSSFHIFSLTHSTSNF